VLMTGTPLRCTLRDRLLEAEQVRHPVTVQMVGAIHGGLVEDVGVDYVTIRTERGEVDCALFHVVSITW